MRQKMQDRGGQGMGMNCSEGGSVEREVRKEEQVVCVRAVLSRAKGQHTDRYRGSSKEVERKREQEENRQQAYSKETKRAKSATTLRVPR